MAFVLFAAAVIVINLAFVVVPWRDVRQLVKAPVGQPSAGSREGELGNRSAQSRVMTPAAGGLSRPSIFLRSSGPMPETDLDAELQTV